ncbi:hypothetical protein [Lachnoclostridium phytofermentans]|uniref:hypothetical protein n=1 Tax=Lachnoclostridium phytofermentans TaxID=66219 RepID=UPI0018DF88BC|nr:hypothetical protein [Lachnoclostridium phytofermentans]
MIRNIRSLSGIQELDKIVGAKYYKIKALKKHLSLGEMEEADEWCNKKWVLPECVYRIRL